MANVKITDLSAGTALGGTELFESVQSSTSVKISATQIKTFANDSVTISGGTISSVTISNSTGSFNSITITAGTVPFNTITNRAYAQLVSTRDQTATSANVAYAVSFDTASSWNSGITTASSTNITFATAGVYLCSMNFQLKNTNTSNHTVTIWYQKNGVNAANSGSLISVPKATDGGVTVFELTFQEQVTAGQYLTLYWSTDNTSVSLDYTAASAGPPSVPAVPSIIFTAHRIF